MRREWKRQEVLGKTFLSRLDEVVLQIGQDVWTRRQLVEDLKCGNFRAARILTAAVQRFKPKNLRELARRTNVYDLFMVHGVGEVTVYVWMCAIESMGANPVQWLDGDGGEVTLATYKNRAITLAEQQQKKGRTA